MKTFNWQDYHHDIMIGKREYPKRVYTEREKEIKRKRRNLSRQKKTE